jgi:2-oxoglutarate ferredoxin oxidoreductase subunit alpha
MNKQLMSGNSAIGESAIQAGCKFYFGYPITPQNELPEYMSARLDEEKGGVFLQAESEVGAINMVIGASSVGARVMTSSSSPGISLKQEGISYLAGQELPAVIVNVVRGGPGLGSIYSAQSDYFQSTRGGGHGDYRTIVLAPASVQELADMTSLAFDLADSYRTPVIISADGVLGQMMEPVRIPARKGRKKITKDYALTGAKGRPSKAIHSFRMDPKDQEDHNWKLMRKYKRIEQREVRYETFLLDDAEMAVLAYGTAARIARGAINRLRKENLKVGLIRPKTLWPFPVEIIRETAKNLHDFFVFEMSAGQMIEDVKLALNGSGTIHFYGRPGGVIPSPVELYRIISRHYYQSQRKRGK